MSRTELADSEFITISNETRETLLSKYILTCGQLSLGFSVTCGIITYFQEMGVWPNFSWISCTATGALVALPICLGLDMRTFSQHLIDTFGDLTFVRPSIINYLRLPFRGYLEPKSPQKRIFISFMVKEGTGKDDITFQELYDLTGVTFIVSVTDYNSGRLYYLSYLTTPDMSVVTAVDVSTDAAFIFAPEKLRLPPLYEERYYYGGDNTDGYPVDAFLPYSRYYFQRYLPEGSEVQVPIATKDNFMGVRLAYKYFQSIPDLLFPNTGISNIRDRVNRPLPSAVESIRFAFNQSQDVSLTEELYGQTVDIQVKVPTSVNTVSGDRFARNFNLGLLEGKRKLETYNSIGRFQVNNLSES